MSVKKIVKKVGKKSYHKNDTAIRQGIDAVSFRSIDPQQGLTIVHCAAARGHRGVLEYIVRELLDEDPMDSDYEDDDDEGPLGAINLNAVSGKVWWR